MNTWYTIKVKYTKQLEDGRLKRVTEPYLVDAVSFTDAEARIYEVVGSTIQGEFLVTGISRTDVSDIFAYDDCDDWYKCKVTYITADEESGKEKKITNYFYVNAMNVNQAYERVQEGLKEMMVTCEIPAITLTSIVEVIPYDPNLDVEISRTPITQETEAMSSEEVYEEEEFDEEQEEEEFESTIEDETEDEI